MAEEMRFDPTRIEEITALDQGTLDFAKKVVEAAMAAEIAKSEPQLNERIAPLQAIIDDPDVPAHLKSGAYTEIFKIWGEDKRSYGLLEKIRKELDVDGEDPKNL